MDINELHQHGADPKAEHELDCPDLTGSVPNFSVTFEKDDRGRPRIYLRVPCSDEWGNSHCQHSIDAATAARLHLELEAASRWVHNNTEKRHKYEPNKKYPWFCKHCGYPDHNEVMHLPNK